MERDHLSKIGSNTDPPMEHYHQVGRRCSQRASEKKSISKIVNAWAYEGWWTMDRQWTEEPPLSWADWNVSWAISRKILQRYLVKIFGENQSICIPSLKRMQQKVCEKWSNNNTLKLIYTHSTESLLWGMDNMLLSVQHYICAVNPPGHGHIVL